jgi:hypothetical protein
MPTDTKRHVVTHISKAATRLTRASGGLRSLKDPRWARLGELSQEAATLGEELLSELRAEQAVEGAAPPSLPPQSPGALPQSEPRESK